MSLSESIFFRLLVGTFVILLAVYMAKETNNKVVAGWYYSVAIIFDLLFIGYLIFNFENKLVLKFCDFLSYVAGFSLVVFVLSLFDIFDGPYGSICRWPMISGSFVFFISAFIGYLSVYFSYTSDFYDSYEGASLEDADKLITQKDIKQYFLEKKWAIINSFIGLLINSILFFSFTFLPDLWKIRCIFFLVSFDFFIIGALIIFKEKVITKEVRKWFLSFAFYLALTLSSLSILGIWFSFGETFNAFLKWPGIVIGIILIFLSKIGPIFFYPDIGSNKKHELA